MNEGSLSSNYVFDVFLLYLHFNTYYLFEVVDLVRIIKSSLFIIHDCVVQLLSNCLSCFWCDEMESITNQYFFLIFIVKYVKKLLIRKLLIS